MLHFRLALCRHFVELAAKGIPKGFMAGQFSGHSEIIHIQSLWKMIQNLQYQVTRQG
jgi:hypothetical protein